VRPGDAREIVLGSSVTSMDVRTLATTAEQIAVRAQGHQRTLPIRVEVDDPVLAWYFRDAAPPSDGAPPGVVTLFSQDPQAAEADYIGARFATRETWDTLGLSLDTWLEWVMFRTAAAEPPLASQAVTLWEKK